MQKKRAQSRMSLFWKFMLSYTVCLFIVASVVGSAVYFRVLRDYNREIDQLNEGVMEQYAGIFQTRVISPVEEAAVNMASGLNAGVPIHNIFYSNGLSLNTVFAFHKNLKDLRNQNLSLYGDIRVFSLRDRFILSSTIGLYYLEDHKEPSRYRHAWIDELPGVRRGWLAPADPEYPDAAGAQISFALTYPTSADYETAAGYIVFDVNERYLKDILASVSSDGDEALMVIGPGDTVISSLNGEQTGRTLRDLSLPEGGAFLAGGEGGGVYSYKAEDGQKALCYSAPLSNGWRIVRVVSSQVMYASFYAMLEYMYIATFAALAVGLVMSAFFSHRLYTPVRTITRWLSAETPFRPADGHKNEYAFIDNAMKRMQTEIAAMRDHMEDNRQLIKAHLITTLVNGTLYSMENFEKRMEQLGLRMAAKKYCVIRVALSSTMINAPEPEAVELIKRDIQEKLEALSDENQLIIACEIKKDELAAVVMSAGGELFDSLEDLGFMLLERYERHIEMSVGQWRDDPLTLNESYLTAQRAREYHFFHPDWLYCAWQKIEDTRKTACETLLRQRDAYIRAVKARKSDEAVDALHLFSYEAQDHVYPFGPAMAALDAMAEEAVSTAQEGAREAREEMESFQKKRGQYKNIREYALELCLLTRMALENAAETEETPSSQLVEQLQHYIRQNLHTDLSLTMLADSVHLSSSYLSRLFKKETGATVIDYITEQRLEQGRQLIEQTDQSIEAITLQVGYPTHHYFSRRFKQRYGLAPKDYRRQYRLNAKP